MKLHPPPARSTTLHRLRRSQGLCVRAERGWLRVTVEGDPADIELASGDSRNFNGPSTVVLSTLCGDAVAYITATAAKAVPAWTERLQGLLRSATAQRVPA